MGSKYSCEKRKRGDVQREKRATVFGSVVY